MFKWIRDVYFWLLWFTGFSDTDGEFHTPDDREKITYMLRRMKERMGLLWWFLSLGAILGVLVLCMLHSWAWAFLEAFQLWLFVHVLYPYTPPDNIWKSK